MDDNRPLFVTSEKGQNIPLLIIDKQGTIGVALAEVLQQEFLVVLVTAQEVPAEKNIIHIPYRKKIPSIPENAYSHTFIVYDGEKEIIDRLPYFSKKAKASQGLLFFITSLTQTSEILFKRLARASISPEQIIIYGELFDEDASTQTVISYFIRQAKAYQRIELANEGLIKHFPVALVDAVRGIISVAFSQTQGNAITCLFSRYPATEFSIARFLQLANPLIKIDFKKTKVRQPTFYLPANIAFLFPEYNLEGKLSSIDMSKPVSGGPFKNKEFLPVQQKHKRRFPLLFTTVLITFIILPFFLIAGTILIGMVAAGYALQIGEQGQFENAQKASAISKSSFAWAESLINNFFLLDIVSSPQKQIIMDKVIAGKNIAETEDDLFSAIKLARRIYTGKSADPNGDFYSTLADVKDTLLMIQKMKVDDNLPDSISGKMAMLDPLLPILESTIDTYPYLLGFEGKREYLVLFQNNMEIRPGGGFIGSYGLLTLDKGGATFKVNDVYDIDGKLTQNIIPPYGLQKYLGTSHLFLHDSNFDVDFINDAKQASFFYQLETGRRVDGVIGVDTDFLKSLLEVMGSVYVPDFKENVSAQNFYLLTQTHAEKDFFPGSTQKRDFLRALYNAMLIQFFQGKNVSTAKLISAIGSGIRAKHISFFVSDPAVQQQFTANNLSSSIWDGREQRQNTFLDYFGVVDANIGLNKVNYYTKRSFKQMALITDKGDLQETAEITYTNTSSIESPFGGDYKDYLRFILPQHASLQGVKIDGKSVTIVPAVTDPAIYTQKGFIPPKGLEMETIKEQGKIIVGFFVIVPTKSTKKIFITYVVPKVVPSGGKEFSYSMHYFKQPGSQEDPYSFEIGYPSYFQLVDQDSDTLNLGSKRVFEGVLSEDKDLIINFSRK